MLNQFTTQAALITLAIVVEILLAAGLLLWGGHVAERRRRLAAIVLYGLFAIVSFPVLFLIFRVFANDRVRRLEMVVFGGERPLAEWFTLTYVILLGVGAGTIWLIRPPQVRVLIYLGSIIAILSVLQFVLLLTLALTFITSLIVRSDAGPADGSESPQPTGIIARLDGYLGALLRIGNRKRSSPFASFVAQRFLRSTRASVKSTRGPREFAHLVAALFIGWGGSWTMLYYYAKLPPLAVIGIGVIALGYCMVMLIRRMRWVVRIFSLNSVISIVGVSLGVWALITVLSVMGGFADNLKQKILRTTEHVRLQTDPLDKGTNRYFELMDRVRTLPDVVDATPFIRYDVMIASTTNISYVTVKGVNPEKAAKLNSLKRDLITGDLYFLDNPESMLGDQGLFPDAQTRYFDRRFLRFGTLPKLPSPPLILPTELKPPGKPKSRPATRPSGKPDGSPTATSRKTTAPPLGPATSKPTSKPRTKTVRRDLDDDPLPIRSFRTLPKVHPGIVIGRELAYALNVTVGSEVELISPEGASGPVLAPRNWRYRVAGVFKTGNYEFDIKLVYLSLPEAQRFFNFGDQVQGIEVKVERPLDTTRFERALRRMLSAERSNFPNLNFKVLDWKRLNRNLFTALKLERIVIFVILGLIIFVASFSITGTLVMIILEKTQEVSILIAMGTSRGGILRIFMSIGASIGVLGTVCGLISGLMLVFLVSVGVPTPEWLYVESIPVNVDWWEIAKIGVASILITTVATLPPAIIASKLDPVEGLRYE